MGVLHEKGEERMNGCKNCPAYAKCTVSYRGSACAALRHTYGLDNDPEIVTHADRIRAMSDVDLAVWLADDSWDCHNCSEHERLSDNPLLRDERCDEKCAEHCLDWLRQPIKDGEGEW